MHIAHVLLTKRLAGTERHVIDLANEQVRNHRVTVVLRQAAAEERSDAFARYFDARIHLEYVGNVFPDWQAHRALKRLRPDVAHAHLNRAARALQGLQGRMLCVSTLHIAFQPKYHAHLDGVIAIAPWQLSAIPMALRACSTQIDNWSKPVAVTMDARKRLRAMYGVGEHQFLWGALARIEHSKGMDVLLDAWIQAKLPNARLAIVGQGSAWKSLRKQAPTEVIMPGFCEYPQDWMSAFDGFVSPARFEPFGLTFLEAMHAGLPILASASEGACYLAPWIHTPLVQRDDPSVLAQGLRAISQEGLVRRHYDLSRFQHADKVREVEVFYDQGLRRLGRFLT